MTRFSLLIRNLNHFRGVNIAVIAGMAVATAVLTGALMVGDSVRGSLTELAVQRLGPVDYALLGTRFFNQSLAGRIAQSGKQEVIPAIIVRGAALADREQTHTADVQIAGVGTAGGDLPKPSSGACLINRQLASDLSIKTAGDSLVFSVPTDVDTPRDATLAQTQPRRHAGRAPL